MKNMIVTSSIVLIAITLITLSSLFSNMLRYKNLCEFVAYESAVFLAMNGYDDDHIEEFIKKITALNGLDGCEYDTRVEEIGGATVITVIIKSKAVVGKGIFPITDTKIESGDEYE